SSAKADSLADACRDLDPVVVLPALLVTGSNGERVDSGSPHSLRLLDPRSDLTEGLSWSSSSSRLLFRMAVSP
nr:hypothetical protein [Tanacetum cinerariifolium]